MIAPLRTRHRVVTTLLALVVPVLFLYGLGARRPIPANDTLPIAAQTSAPEGAESIAFGDVPVDARYWDGASGPHVQVAWRAAPVAPDVLVYWSAGSGGGEELPAGATFVGAVEGRALRLPSAGGTVVLYSLAHRAVVGRAALPDGGAS